MSENRRELLRKTMDNEQVHRVPCGFWHHFILGRDQFIGLEEPEVLDRTVEGHKRYYELVQPDMMKIMNEGFFGYPPIMDNPLETESDLLKIKAVGPDHPWITEQVKHVKRISDLFKDEVMCYYNIFAPQQVLRIKFDFLDQEYDHYVRLAEAFPEALLAAGKEIAKDIQTLIEKLFEADAIDGIYYCVQNVQSEKYDLELHNKIIRPVELPVLKRANELSQYNILHICGYANYTNDFEYYKDYPAKVYNWAVHTEGIDIREGKEYFNGACVLGGFDNNPGSLIDTGSKEEIRAYVKKLIDENGFTGYIMGADCSIPNDIDDRRVRYIRDCVHEFAQQ